MKHKVTLNPGFGASYGVAGLGKFESGKPRSVDLSAALADQLSRSRMWTVEPAGKKKVKKNTEGSE